MAIYELSEEFATLYNALDDMDLSDAESVDKVDEMINALSDMEKSAKDYVEQFTRIDRNIGSDIDALDSEIKRLQNRLKSLKASRERSRAFLMTIMTRFKLPKVKTGIATVSVSTTAGKLVINDLQKALASGYVKNIEPDESWIDKTEMKKAILAGEEIEGCEIVKEQTLKIR